MNQDPYVTFINAKGNAFTAVIAWIGSVLGPAYIYLGWGIYNEWPLYLGCGLSVFVLISIKCGFNALSKGVHSDFVVYSVVPVLVPIVTVVSLWAYNA